MEKLLTTRLPSVPLDEAFCGFLVSWFPSPWAGCLEDFEQGLGFLVCFRHTRPIFAAQASRHSLQQTDMLPVGHSFQAAASSALMVFGLWVRRSVFLASRKGLLLLSSCRVLMLIRPQRVKTPHQSCSERQDMARKHL